MDYNKNTLFAKRINEINSLIDNYVPNSITILKEKYSNELDNYKYIETIEEFSLLKLRGSLKYINKYDGNLRAGGLLIKIYKKDNNWIAIIKQMSGKRYNVSFKSNHIFYTECRTDSLRDWAECFISECDSGKYIIN
jgi:hypothetical protein|uniref:Uncharacterized protein n=1 Tax=viral metagenome TaxID=1070528 RepID=A0A6C0EBJ3_9ZZZZ